MNVGINHTGENVQPAGIDDLPAGSLQIGFEGGNPPVRHTDIEGLGGGGGDHGSSAEEEVEFRHAFYWQLDADWPTVAGSRSTRQLQVAHRPPKPIHRDDD